MEGEWGSGGVGGMGREGGRDGKGGIYYIQERERDLRERERECERFI